MVRSGLLKDSKSLLALYMPLPDYKNPHLKAGKRLLAKKKRLLASEKWPFFICKMAIFKIKNGHFFGRFTYLL